MLFGDVASLMGVQRNMLCVYNQVESSVDTQDP